MDIRRTVDIKLNVKPIFPDMYHDYVFEGPCRFGSGQALTREYDQAVNRESYEQWVKELETNVSGAHGINLLPPLFIERNEEFQTTETSLEKMAEDNEKTDVYLFGQHGRTFDWIVEFAQRYRKPILFSGWALLTTCTAAALIGRGLETYPTCTWSDLIEQMKVLRVRKILQNTRILCAPRADSIVTFSCTDNFLSHDKVTQTLGTRFWYVSAHELLDQTHHVAPDTNHTTPGRIGLNPTDEDMKIIGEITDKLIGDALECHMEREDILNSVKAYYTVKKFLEYNECNAFTMPCPDVCATRRLNEEKITFCLAHSLLNEEGIPSACEYDVPALLSMVVLMNLANSAPYIGNTQPTLLQNGTREGFGARFFTGPDTNSKDVPALGDQENIMFTWHSVPNRQLKGFGECGPYTLRPFARDQKFGATIRYDFKNDIGQVVTMCRFDPTCTKLFVAKGIVVGGFGYTDVNCSEGVFFKVEDEKDFFNKQVAFGNHVPLVYGDHFKSVVALGEMLGLEVITA